MEAVAYDSSVEARAILLTAREQMARFKDHGIEPGFVLMTANHYDALKNAVGDDEVCHNSDTDSINGLPIVICEKTVNPTVTATPSSLLKAGLL
ncbi:hypothetical protein KA005_13705 [bacterium]|nr:hypothetical protein [bacterium]